MATDQTIAGGSREEFLRNLEASGLSGVGELLALAADPESVADGLALARDWVAAGHLTEYQADAVLERRLEDLRVGNYDVLARLGAGGMGTVYKARHRRMKRVVAIKVLANEVAGNAQFAQRFQREVETIARLAHPNIVMAFDADESERGPFLVMEFVNGRDLATEVERGGPLSAADAVECILQAARGLEYAHAQGIVHRDIKPANLLRDEAGAVKVADLGLARLTAAGGAESGANTSLTRAGGIVGTVDYMAPEQALDSTAVDQRVDVYSLGCTLYFLLTGRPPYTAGSIMALLLKHRDAPIPSLAADRPDVPPALDAVFQRMAAKDPADRLPTMSDLVRALEELKAAAGLTDARPSVAPSGVNPSNPTASLGSAPETTAVTPPSVARPAVRTVVLAEPSRTQAGIIRRYLAELGVVDVHTAGSGREAIELAKRFRADAIVAAMHLSDTTGVELARAVLADAGCEGIGFLLATSASDAEGAGALPVSPRTAIVTKPFDGQQLVRSIAAVARPPAAPSSDR